AADRALRSGVPRPHSRTTRDGDGGPPERESQLRGRRDHGRRRRSRAVLRAARGATRPVLHPAPAALHLLGVDTAGRRGPRDVRLLRGPERAPQAEAAPRESSSAGLIWDPSRRWPRGHTRTLHLTHGTTIVVWPSWTSIRAPVATFTVLRTRHRTL